MSKWKERAKKKEKSGKKKEKEQGESRKAESSTSSTPGKGVTDEECSSSVEEGSKHRHSVKLMLGQISEITS